ncbi:MAG: sortase [Ilumatobacteraceae bacterium]
MARSGTWAGVAFVVVVAGALGAGLLLERQGEDTSSTATTPTAPNAAATSVPLDPTATTAVRPTVPPGLAEITAPPEGTGGAALPGQEAAIPPAANEGQWVGSIEIPKIGLTSYVFEGVQLTTLDLGPGHWPGTAMPGQAGNVVLAGHRTTLNKAFADLDQLEPDDEVTLNTAEGTYVYDVVSTEIVDPSALWIADQTEEPTATLFACHPPGSVSQRIVVRLELDG